MTSPSDLPSAILKPRRRWNWAWLLPIVAVIGAAPAAWHAWGRRSDAIVIHFPQGQGLRVSDTVRCRGIVVGEVRSITLEPGLSGVRVEVILDHQSAGLARDGTLFWIVRPRIGWGGIAGLDTLAGARYIDVLDGSGAAQSEFTGLDDPPISALCPPGGLEIVVQAVSRGGIRPGSPVMYRQIPIGRVISTALSGDGGAVEVRCFIDPAYTALVKTHSVFWQDSGISFHAGFKDGIRASFDSMETLLSGGVAMATPPEAGEAVTTGHRFVLQQQVNDEWLGWQPAVAVGATLDGEQLPRPLSATVECRYRELLIHRTRIRHGWTLPLAAGLLGTSDLLHPEHGEGGVKGGSLELQIAGGRFPLVKPPLWEAAGLCIIPLDPLTISAQPAWPRSRLRQPHAVEDCLVIGDPLQDAQAIDGRRLHATANGWIPDHALAMDRSWEGAAVVARSDGAVIGVLHDQGTALLIVPLGDLTGVPDVPPRP